MTWDTVGLCCTVQTNMTVTGHPQPYLPPHLLDIIADFLHCIVVEVDDGYTLMCKPMTYWEVIHDLDGNLISVPCKTT